MMMMPHTMKKKKKGEDDELTRWYKNNNFKTKNILKTACVASIWFLGNYFEGRQKGKKKFLYYVECI